MSSHYQFQVKHFNFVRRPSPWQEMQKQHARFAKMSAEFQSANSAASASMFSAIGNQVSGLATNAAQAGLARIQAELKTKADAKIKQLDDAVALVDQTKVAIDNPAIASTDSSSQSGTGTVIDTVA